MFVQLLDKFPPDELQKRLDMLSETQLVKHVADPDEAAEAYIFLMKWVFKYPWQEDSAFNGDI